MALAYLILSPLALAYFILSPIALAYFILLVDSKSSVFVLTTFILIIIGKPAFSEPWKHDKFNELEDDTKVEPTSTTA